MPLCSVDEVRTYCSPVSVTNIDILDIIYRVSVEILLKAGSTDETNSYLIQAGVHAAVAATMKKARSNGELADRVSVDGYSQQNTGLNEEIKGHETEAEFYIQKYIAESSTKSYAIVSGRMGFGTVNSNIY
jgi:hypothetical protein